MVVINSATSQLMSITLNYNSNVEGTSVDPLLTYGDLFLGVSGPGTWNYVVRSPFADPGTYTDTAVRSAQTSMFANLPAASP